MIISAASLLSGIANALSLGQALEPAVRRIMTAPVSASRRIPQTRAGVADAINGVVPSTRATWTGQQLFLVLCAFARVHVDDAGNPIDVQWVRTPDDIARLILRGARADRSPVATVHAEIVAESAEVARTLLLVPALAAHRVAAPVSETAPAQAHPPLRSTLASVLESAHEARRKLMRIPRRGNTDALAALLAGALLDGGFSTLESRELLLMQGLSQADVDAALGLRE